MIISAFITHKKAENFSDCQDRFSINVDTKSIALADGLSQSLFPKYWADILVRSFTSNPEWIPNLASVRELAPQWLDIVNSIVQKQYLEGCNSAWRAERSLKEGRSAGATFVGLRFNNYQWECDVLGDSCLVQVSNNQITKILTSEEVSAFDNFPDYYDSNPQKDGKGQLLSDKGIIKEGETLLLVSDPFSDFLLKNKGSEVEQYPYQSVISNKFS